MADPISIITGILGADIIKTIYGGIIESGSDALFCDGLKKFRDNLNLHQQDANHDVARAIYRSYLQATLQVCAMRGESLGIPVERCVLRETFTGWLKTTGEKLQSSSSAAIVILSEPAQQNSLFDKGRRAAGRLLEKVAGAARREHPLGFLSQTEAEWLDRVATATRRKIDDLDNEKLEIHNLDLAHQPELLLQPENKTAAERVSKIRADLLERVTGELISEYGQPPADEFVRLMRYGWMNHAQSESGIYTDWFTLFCACFQYQLKHDELARAAFQNNILAQLKIDGQAVSLDAARQQLESIGGEVCRKLDDVRKSLSARFDVTDAMLNELLPLIALTRDIHTTIQRLPELIWQEGVKTRDAVERKGDETIEVVTEAVREGSRQNRELLLQALATRTSLSIETPLVQLPEDRSLIVDREVEIALLLNELKKPDGLSVLPIIAPSGFGKTSFVTKLLREITSGAQITIPEVQAIAFVKCKENEMLLAVMSAADQLTGGQEISNLLRLTRNAGESIKKLSRDFFSYLSQLGNVWIVLDNFESWLDAERRIKDEDTRQWFETALEQQHSVRLILTSQFLPELSSGKLQRRLKRIEAIETGLDNGLPEADALQYLRDEGRDCGLAEADESLLLQFIRGVHRIPKAMESLIGYLSDDEVLHAVTFEQLMRDPQLQATFRRRDHEHREDGAQYLIGLQLARLADDELKILSALVFFGGGTPRQALAGLAEEKRLTAILNRLHKNRLIRFERDLFGVTRYTVQPYIAQNEELQQASLPSEYADDLIELGNQAGEKANHRLARDLQKCAETIYRALIAEGRFELRNDLAMAVMNKGVALRNLNEQAAAITCYDEAIATYRALIAEGRFELRNELAKAVMNKGAALYSLNDLTAAITCYDEAIKTYRALIAEGRFELRNDLARALANKGLALWAQEDYNLAYSHLNEAVSLLEECVKAGQEQFRGLLDKFTGRRDKVRKLMSGEL